MGLRDLPTTRRTTPPNAALAKSSTWCPLRDDDRSRGVVIVFQGYGTRA